MQIRTFLPDGAALACETVTVEQGRIRISVSSSLPMGTCPRCGRWSSRVHSHYVRRLADLPWHGAQVTVTWRSRRFFCTSPNCPQRIFTERLPHVARPYARKTERLAVAIQCVGVVPNAYYWHGNQPDIASVYLFNAAGRPDLTQKWVRWILDHKYGDQENGLDGNDDGGTLSAWYVLSSLGLYPVAGSERYEIGTPIWKRGAVQTGSQRLVITAGNVTADNYYIQRAWLNDKPLDRRSLTHGEIAHGAVLRLEMGPRPGAP